MSRSRWLPFAALLGAILCWSSVPLFLKHFTAELDAWTVNGVRYAIAAVLLLPFTLRAGRAPAPPGIWRAALIPAAINTLGQIGWALCPYFIEASVIAFGIRSAFFFAVLATLWLLPEERFILRRPSFWGGSAICITGITLLFLQGLHRSHTSLTGSIILLATAVVWGFYGVTVRKFMRAYSPLNSFGVICTYTALVLAVLMVGFGRISRLGQLDMTNRTLLFVSAIVGIVSAHVLIYFVIQNLGPLVASGAQFVTPFLTFFGAMILFGEHLTATQWFGGLAVIAGSALLVRSRLHAENTTPEQKEMGA